MLLNNLAQMLSLDGRWKFSTGDSDSDQEIEVPGCWEAQGYPKTLEGPVRYRRTFQLPGSWSGYSLQLEFGAVSYASSISINGRQVGAHQGMWTPFSLDITAESRPGEINEIEVEVIKPGINPGARYPIRASLAGFLPDLATTFGGIWQPVLLRAMKTAIHNLQITGDYDRRVIIIQGGAQAFHHTLKGAEWDVQVYYQNRTVASFHTPCQEGLPLSASLPLSRVKFWSPDHPSLYTVQVSVYDQSGLLLAQVSRMIGFRRLAARGEQLLLNEKPLMVRGILAWGWEPDRIAPYYTLEQARHEMRKVRAMGFNCIKLCLFIPNPAYFQAADEEGILLWQEFPMWLPKVTPALRTQAPIEYTHIADFVSQHPSVAIYSLGCEMNRSVDLSFMSQLNNVVRKRAHDSLVCDNSGSGESYGGLDVDFADFTDYHPYYDIHYFEPLLDHWRRDWQPPRPWIFGEFCDSDTFRDLDEIIKNNGGEPPWWMTGDNPVTSWRPEAVALTAEDQLLVKAGLQDKKADLIRISHAQAALIRKFTLETLRRRKAIGGYIITGLRDTPISTSGIWDDLGRPKWPSAEFREVNDEDLLALDLDRRRTWQNGGDRPDRLDPYNFWAGSQARWHVILHAAQHSYPAGSQFNWRLTTPEGVVQAQGEQILDRQIPAGQPVRLGTITCTMPVSPRPMKLHLSIMLNQDGKRAVTNHWPIWVYPPPKFPPSGPALYDPSGYFHGLGDWAGQLPQVNSNDRSLSHQYLLTTVWNNALARHVKAGARVLLCQTGDGPLPVRRCPFWRESIKFFLPHPLWERFPHPGFTGMQFFGMASDLAFESSRLAQVLPRQAEISPLLRRLDAREFHLSEYLFEASLGNGLLLGCSLNLAGGDGAQPYGYRRNIAGSALLNAMVDYLINPD